MIKCHLTADAIMDISGTVGGFVGFSLLSGRYLNIYIISNFKLLKINNKFSLLSGWYLNVQHVPLFIVII